jgi:hypothetical protein
MFEQVRSVLTSKCPIGTMLPEDDFGADDDDWAVYREIVSWLLLVLLCLPRADDRHDRTAVKIRKPRRTTRTMYGSSKQLSCSTIPCSTRK